MRDYAELVKALRYCGDNDRQGCAKECRYGKEHPPNFRCIGFLFADAADAIEELLAAVPKRGEWLITDAYPHRVYCSVCYKTYLPNADWELWSDGRIPRNFCPHCGARMTEVSDDA